MQQNFKEVYRYINALCRYRHAAIILALLVVTVVSVYSFSLPKIYKADSTVFIEKSVIDQLVRGIAVTPNIQDKVRVLKYALSSRDLIVKTLEEIDSPIFTKSKAEQQKFISDLKDRTIINVRRNDLFIVSLTDKDPNFVYKYVNALVSKYVEENVSDKRDEAYGANRFLDEQIELFKEKLQKAEDAIIDFRRKQGLYTTTNETALVSEIKNYMSEIEQIEFNLQTLTAQKKDLQAQLKNLNPSIESLFSSQGNGSGPVGNPKLVELEKRLSDLRLRYTDNYPGIIQLKSEIENLRKNLNNKTDTQENTSVSDMNMVNPLYLDVKQRILEAQSQITSLQSKKQNLQTLIAKREKELHEVPESRKELKVLIEERDSHQKIYQNLLSRMSQSEVSKQMEIGNKTATFRVVDPAVYPEVPVSPNMKKMFLLAIFAGVASVAGLVFLLETLDMKARNIDDFKDLGVEVLAVVPTIVDPDKVVRKRRIDLIFYLVTGAYAACIIGVLALEAFSKSIFRYFS